jgi:RNA polymerase sigma-70 factor (ECF subfamily)
MSIDADETLRALHDAHAGPLWRYVVALTGSTVDADDVVQETLLRAWRRPRLLAEEPSGVRSWMFTVARNLVIDDARSARRRRELGMADTPDRAVLDRTDQVLDRMLIADALTSLSPEHRAVIVTAYFGGRNTSELAEELGIPEGTVKSRLHYGLRALRLALQERGVTR